MFHLFKVSTNLIFVHHILYNANKLLNINGILMLCGGGEEIINQK